MDWVRQGDQVLSDQGRIVLCTLDELEDPGSRGFSVPHGDRLLEMFVVRRGSSVYGYRNSCPHTGAPLDWMPNEFLSLDRRHIQCAMHAALFRLADGMCVAGPCAGDALSSVALQVESGIVSVSATTLAALG